MACVDQATGLYLNQCCLFYWRIYASIGLNKLMQQQKVVSDKQFVEPAKEDQSGQH